jgi:hypothetical protein
MRVKYFLYSLFLAILFIAPLTAQDCTDYHQYHCMYGDFTFYYSKQSKSALFRPGQTSELKIVAYSGEDYYIAVCAHRKFGDIRFRILEDNPSRTLIYDNATDDFEETVVITNDVTRNLIIEVSVPEGDERTKNDHRCVGVVVEYRKTEG